MPPHQPPLPSAPGNLPACRLHPALGGPHEAQPPWGQVCPTPREGLERGPLSLSSSPAPTAGHCECRDCGQLLGKELLGSKPFENLWPGMRRPPHSREAQPLPSLELRDAGRGHQAGRPMGDPRAAVRHGGSSQQSSRLTSLSVNRASSWSPPQLQSQALGNVNYTAEI